MHNNRAHLRVACLLALLILALTACGPSPAEPAPPAPTLAPPPTPTVLPPAPTPAPPTASPAPEAAAAGDRARVAAAGRILVGSALDNPPFDMYNDQFQADGFDVALMNAIAARLGVQAEFADFSFEGLLGALELGQADAVIAAMAVTPERAQRVDFTRSYYRGEDAILAGPESPITEVKTAADVAARRVGVLRGSVYESFLLAKLVEPGQMPSANLQSYGRMEDALGDLYTGRIDLVIMDRLPALSYVARDVARMVGQSVYVQEYAIAVRKGSTLLPDLNRALAQLEADGTVARLAAEYLKVPADQVARLPTPTPEPTAPPEATPSPVPTAAPTPTPAPIDGMEFSADLTLPDYTKVQPGQALQKGWRLKNVGTTTWSAEYRLEYASGNTPVSQMGGQPVRVGRAVGPGETADIYVDLVAPHAPGDYRGDWVIKDAAGRPFGKKVFVIVAVPAPPTPVPPPTATPAPGISFRADRSRIQAGECANLAWNVTGVKAVYLCPQGQSCQGVSGQGGQQVCPGSTTRYELRIERTGGGTETRETTIEVAVPANAPRIARFDADRDSVRSGDCLNLWWKVEGNASRIALVRDGRALQDYAPAEHNYLDCPTEGGKATYELHVWGPGGSGPVKQSRQVKVEEAAPQPPQTLQLDEGACGSQHALRPGDMLIMLLSGAGGSGYQWEQAEVNPSVLTPSGVSVQPGGAPGAADLYVFTYTAGPGRTTLRLVYHRPSEGDAPPAKECLITVTVR